MTKKLKISLILLVAIAAVLSFMILYPRFVRCYDYYKFTSENSEDLCVLANKPSEIEFSEVMPLPNFSIGYAQFYIEPNTIRSIRFLEAHTAIFIDCDDYHLGFLSPTIPAQMFSNAVVQTAKLPGKTAGLFKLMIDAPFEAQIKIASVCPKTYPQIFMMSEDTYDEYSILCMFKTMLNYNNNGIGSFKTDAINGIVRFGAANKPNQILAEIFSKDSGITQEIVITSSSCEKSRQAMAALLSSYSLLIRNVPKESSLHQSIVERLSSNPKFILDAENKITK